MSSADKSTVVVGVAVGGDSPTVEVTVGEREGVLVEVLTIGYVPLSPHTTYISIQSICKYKYKYDVSIIRKHK